MNDKPAPRSSRFKRVLTVVTLLAVAGAGGWYIYNRTGETAAVDASAAAGGKHGKGAQSVPVALATIGTGDIDIIDQGLGTVTSLASVTVRTQINGTIQQIAFQEGQIVHQGDLLVQIDARPYEMTLEQANGALQRDQALLHEAQIDLERYKKLVSQDSISKQQLDQQTSLVGQYEGNVVTDQGQIDAAKLNINYCHVVAPISGRVGLRQVDIGNYAQTSDTNGLVSLTQLDPISVLFTLPEDQLPAVMKRLASGAELKVEAYDRAQTTKLAEGKLSAVDNEIDTSTGTVKLRAQFDNADNILFPNQFVNIQLVVDTLHNIVIAPQAGILHGAPGTFVYVANDDHTVSIRTVKLGPSQGDNIQVTDGLAAGDKIVIDGTDKLRDGATYKLPESGDANQAGGDKAAVDKPADSNAKGDKSNSDKPKDNSQQSGHHHHSSS